MQWCGNIDFLSKTRHRPRPRIERMIGFLIEHYAGNFPAWLSPEQARVIPITDGQNEYAQGIVQQLREQSLPPFWIPSKAPTFSTCNARPG